MCVSAFHTVILSYCFKYESIWSNTKTKTIKCFSLFKLKHLNKLNVLVYLIVLTKMFFYVAFFLFSNLFLNSSRGSIQATAFIAISPHCSSYYTFFFFFRLNKLRSFQQFVSAQSFPCNRVCRWAVSVSASQYNIFLGVLFFACVYV